MASVDELGSWELCPEVYGVTLDADVFVAMSDGVKINVRVVYPADLQTGERAAGDFPVLLEQSPYPWHHEDTLSYARYLVSRGYIMAIAQVRGTWRSQGEFGFQCAREKQDGVELVDWAAHDLVGSNGRIGLIGCSYTGSNQYSTAAMVGPDSPVKAAAPAGFGAHWYRSMMFSGGAPNGTAVDYPANWREYMGTEQASALGKDLIDNYMSGGAHAYDREFWQERMPARYIEQIVRNGIPVLIWSGWNDNPSIPTTALEAFAMFQNAYAGRDIWASLSPAQPTTPRYQIVMSNSKHCADGDGGPRDQVWLRWFDSWLKDADTGMRDVSAPMRLFEQTSDRWVTASSYPLVDEYQQYFLGPDLTLGDAPPTAPDCSDRLRYAPPGVDGATLTYTTAPFDRGATLAGPAALSVYLRSTTTDAQLVASIVDLAPDGTATRVTSGALTGSLRALDQDKTWKDKAGHVIRPHHSFHCPEPLVPGEVSRLDIQFEPRLTAIAPGHRIRLVLATQSCNARAGAEPSPCADELSLRIHPTTPQQRSLADGQYEVQRNVTWSSHLNLPILPYGHYASAPD